MKEVNLVAETQKVVFNNEVIFPGCVIRFRRVGDEHFRMGLILKVSPEQILVVYGNLQGGSTSRLELSAKEVMSGQWELYWTEDLQEVFHIVGKGEEH